MSEPTASSYFLGVDGGGSKTLAIIVDAQGNQRGQGLSGSSNYAAVGLSQAVAHIGSAVEEAAREAGCTLPLHAAWLGLAGIDRQDDCETLLPHLRSLAEIVRLTNDAELLLSALDNAVGVALIAGTGSIALARNAQGSIRRAGGWGHILGDEGSGYDIARRGLQAATRAADGREPGTMLLALITQHWNLTSPDGLIDKVYHAANKADIAQVATLVFAAASSGDSTAREIVRQAAQELALAAITAEANVGANVGATGSSPIHRGSGPYADPAGPLPIALGGGLLLHEEDFREQVLDAIRERRAVGQIALVTQPALSAARATIHL
ncbi:MAG TPA: BadF/BadG/BcrA/BcrD ATPase family protein [Ktedonobacteraceae bacterium]|nr:BadF/BadG/BcrA/BcrD ATPase family protein [Ktedonobacteraceae bacterium]